MNPFDYLNVLISIILGLAIAKVLTGLATVITARERVDFYWPPIRAALVGPVDATVYEGMDVPWFFATPARAGRPISAIRARAAGARRERQTRLRRVVLSKSSMVFRNHVLFTGAQHC